MMIGAYIYSMEFCFDLIFICLLTELCQSCQNFSLHSSMYDMLDVGSKQLLEILARCALVLQKYSHLAAHHSSPQWHPWHFRGQEQNSAPETINLTQTWTSSSLSHAEKGNVDLVSQGAHLCSSTLFMISKLQLCSSALT